MENKILAEIFDSSAGSTSTEPALQQWTNGEIEVLTYQEIYEAYQQGANVLKAAGIHAGDRVILLAESRKINWVIALFSIWHLEATAVLLHPSINSLEIKQQILTAKASCAITNSHFHKDIFKDTQLPTFNIHEKLNAFADSNPVQTQLDDKTFSDVACEIQETDFSDIELLKAAKEAIHLQGLDNSERMLNLIPLDSAFGLVNALLANFLAGATLSLLDKDTDEDVLLDLRRAHATILIAYPETLDHLYDKIMHQSLSSGAIASNAFSFASAVSGFIQRRGWGNPGRAMFPVIHAWFGNSLAKMVTLGKVSPKAHKRFNQIGWKILEQ